MALRSLGWVTVPTAGSPVQVSATGVRCHSVFIQQVGSNTAAMHIGTDSNMDPTTGASMLATLPTPTANSLPSYTGGVDQAVAGIDLQEIWIDATVSGEEVLVSYLEA